MSILSTRAGGGLKLARHSSFAAGWRSWPRLGLILGLALAGITTRGAEVASLSGTVVAAGGAGPLAGVRVQVGGQVATADAGGAFTLGELPPGRQMISLSAPGYRSLEVPVILAPGSNVLPAFAMEREVMRMDKVVVAGQRAGAETAFAEKAAADALAEVVTGAALRSATAQSATDLLKNVASVSVSRGTDGASNVTVRGMDSRFVRVTVDGQRQGGAALASIPPEIVQSLEVNKVLTPDQDADAIGGAINVTTGTANLKDSSVQGRHQITVNTLDARPGLRNALTVARPFRLWASESGGPNAGILVTAGFDDLYRRRESIRVLREYPARVSPGPGPFAGQLVPVLTQPRIDATLEHRQRSSLVVNADARFGAGSVWWRSNLTRDWAKRDRLLDDFDPFLGAPLLLAPDHAEFAGVTQNRRNQRQVSERDAANLLLGGRLAIGRVECDATLGAALADEEEPRTLEAVFRSDRTFRTSYDLRQGFLPRFTFVDETASGDTNSIRDPARYLFDNLTDTRSSLRDREYAAKINLKLDLDRAAQGSFLKAGLKIQRRRRDADTERLSYDPGTQSRNMVGVVGVPDASMSTTGYEFGPVPDAGAVAGLLTSSPAVFRLNAVTSLVNSKTGDYGATETIGAAYALGRLKYDRWTMLAGARVEDTRVATEGNQLIIGPSGTVVSTARVDADREYLLLLPGVHLRFDPRPGLLIRAAVTRALNRPSYVELTPARQINFIDRRSRVGNPDLKPYDATNFDLSVDRYQGKVGLLSAAVFAKRIKHVVQDAQYPVTIGELGQFIEFQRINGEDARVWGVETGWQSAKRALPAGIGTGSLGVNYTFLHGDTRIRSRPGESFTLKAQPKHLVNLILGIERSRFSGDATLRYRSKTFEDVIDPGFDNYRVGAFDAEVSVAYKLNQDTRLTLGIGNLLNQPVREYSGTRARMNQYDRAGRDFTLGFQWKVPNSSPTGQQLRQ